jgi:hypothetical protein
MTVTLGKVNVLVYDNSQVFFRWFTKGIPDCIFVDFSSNTVGELNLKDYDFVIFVVERQVNLNEFFKILNSSIQILFLSSLKNSPDEIEELKTWFDIKFININSTKREVRELLRYHLNQYSKNRLDLNICDKNL